MVQDVLKALMHLSDSRVVDTNGTNVTRGFRTVRRLRLLARMCPYKYKYKYFT